MKVVCDACAAKYQIPDERVAGRKLKIRCRKCSGSIIIRGDLLTEAAPDAGAPVLSGDEWHVSIDGEQHGPYTTEQMTSMLGAQQLDWDVYVWREGLPDWQAALECSPLIEAAYAAGVSLPGEAPTVAQEAPTVLHDRADDDHTSMYGAQSHAPGELQPVARAGFAQRAQSTPDLRAAPAATGPNPASAFAPSGEVAQLQPRVSAVDAMTGERHEDSVLFSMGNLKLQAATAPAPVQRAPGYAAGEGSGLIDIRALAALASANRNSVPSPGLSLVPPPGDGDSQEEQLLRLANQTGAFATVDSLAPVSDAPRSSSPAVPIAIFAGATMIAAAVFAAIYITRDATTEPGVVATAAQPEVAAPTATPEPSPEPEPAAEPEADDQELAAADEEAAADEDEAVEEPAEKATPARTKVAKRAPVRRKAKQAKPAAAAAAKTDEAKADDAPPTLDDVLLGGGAPTPAKTEAAAAPEPKPAEPSGPRSLDDLLDGAVVKKEEKPNLPDSPTRDQVLSAIRDVAPAVKACAEESGVTGKAVAAITVKGSTGRVSNVNVTGIQGPVGSCIARAVRGASFPKFSKPTFSVNYPFKL